MTDKITHSTSQSRLITVASIVAVFLCCGEFVRIELMLKEQHTRMEQFENKVTSTLNNIMNTATIINHLCVEPKKTQRQKRQTAQKFKRRAYRDMPLEHLVNKTQKRPENKQKSTLQQEISKALSNIHPSKYWIPIPGPPGPPGHPGQRGERGPRGRKGKSGKRGTRGSRGLKGSPGQNGARGPRGRMGPKGEPGPSAPGQDGAPGPQGKMGPKGLKGEPGLSIQGLKGNPGQSGARGPRGMMGPKGLKGDPSRLPISDQWLNGCGAKVLLKADNGKYLSRVNRNTYNSIEAYKTHPDKSCVFILYKADTKGTIWLTADNHRYLSRVYRYYQFIEADSTWRPGPWSYFRLHSQSDGTTAIQADNGKYWCRVYSNGNHFIQAVGTSISVRCKFRMEYKCIG